MKKQVLVIIIIVHALFVQAQIVPFSMMGNKFAKIQLTLFPKGAFGAGNSLPFYGTLNAISSSVENVEKGIIYLPNSDARILNVDNGNKIIFRMDTFTTFEGTVRNLNFNSQYKLRAYAKNHLNQIAYSTIQTITTAVNYCYTRYGDYYCFNNGICESFWGGEKTCHCVGPWEGPQCNVFNPGLEDSFASQETGNQVLKNTIGSDFSKNIHFQNKLLIASKNYVNEVWAIDP